MIGLARLAVLVVMVMAGLPARTHLPPQGPFAGGSHAVLGAAVEAPVDSAAAELAAGRPWHAARILRSAYPDPTTLDQTGRLVLARAETRARAWERVRRALEGAPWLDQAEGGEGWALLGRALEELGRWEEAAQAYERYLSLPHASSSPTAPALIARRMRALAEVGAWETSHALAPPLRARHEGLSSWLALDLARIGAEQGNVAEVRTLLARIQDPGLRLRGWDLEARAMLAAGDSAGAETLLMGRMPALEPAARRGEAWALVGQLRLRRGDDAGALAAFRSALGERPSVAASARSARGLVELNGLTDVGTALEAARALERAGDVQPALQAYDRHLSLSPDTPPDALRLARAQLMVQLRARQDEAVEEFRALSAAGNQTVGPVALEEWAQLRALQGRAGDVETLRARLVERFPSSAQAANVMFLQADAAHDAGDLTRAVNEYRRLAAAAPNQDRAGLATMRWAQIHVMRGQHAQAAEVFESYLAQFPTGRRWEEATYWAGRSRLALHDTARARALLAELHEREPFGYYAMMASDLVGESFTIDVPEGDVATSAAWVQDGLRSLSLYAEAGLSEPVTITLVELRAQARNAPPAEALLLSNELTKSGRPIDGINVALDLRTRGVPWSRRLLEAVYPLPLPERIEREAREWKADPLLMAALIRQESAWVENIVSSAGAIGLMQVMPETGQALFRQLGDGNFRAEMLEVGDLNMHLGAAYMMDALARYNGDLPLTLSAYNAGPHRADRWKNFPEAADRLRLTERIPFAETRDYVKRVTRNRILYQALYGTGR